MVDNINYAKEVFVVSPSSIYDALQCRQVDPSVVGIYGGLPVFPVAENVNKATPIEWSDDPNAIPVYSVGSPFSNEPSGKLRLPLFWRYLP